MSGNTDIIRYEDILENAVVVPNDEEFG